MNTKKCTLMNRTPPPRDPLLKDLRRLASLAIADLHVHMAVELCPQGGLGSRVRHLIANAMKEIIRRQATRLLPSISRPSWKECMGSPPPRDVNVAMQTAA